MCVYLDAMRRTWRERKTPSSLTSFALYLKFLQHTLSFNDDDDHDEDSGDDEPFYCYTLLFPVLFYY